MTTENAPAGGPTLDAYWHDLVGTAMLGTDRRDPPDPPPGPVADLVDDALRPDGASRMLAAVAAVAAARRAGFVPGRSVTPLRGPEPDVRPVCSPAAVATWRRVVSEWPVLEDEWMLTLIEQGLRLPPDAIVDSLLRHRSDGVRRARVVVAGGPAAAWLAGHFAELEAPSGRRVDVGSVTTVPELPIPPDLELLVPLDAHSFSTRLADGFDSGVFGPPDRAVLVNLIARCRPAVLVDAAGALDRTGVGHALALADLARLRHRMLIELGVVP